MAGDGVMKESDVERIEFEIACSARTHVPVLITSRDSEERERIAHSIHARSTRAQGPFISVNCARPLTPLLSGDLFGDPRESLVGEHVLGVIERAHGGTLFLDHVGELSRPVQTLLSQFLATGGGDSTRSVDVRVITASSRPLIERVLTHEFREDLFYRLNVIHILVSK